MQIFRLTSSALCLVLAACGDTNLVKDAAQAVGIGGEPRPAPDFVTRSRAGGYDYLPVGESAPKRQVKAKDVAGVGKAEAEMDATRASNEARGNAARRAAAPSGE